MAEQKGKSWKRLAAASALGLVCLTAVGMGCRADLRPDALRAIERPSQGDEARGRALMARAAEVHGAEAFRAHASYTMVIRDEWRGLMGAMMNPWPDGVVDAKLSYRTNSFDARAEFLSGSKKGRVWGMQSWKTYEGKVGDRPTFEDNPDARFILPAIQYLTELVFRDHDAQVMTALEPVEIRGRTYDRVFMTWDSLEPTDDHDQYVFYLDPKTGRVEMVEYTVRDIMSMATGVMQFEGYQDFGGVLIPTRQSVTISTGDTSDAWVHRIEVLSVSWDDPGVEAFEVDDGLPSLGDEKLAGR